MHIIGVDNLNHLQRRNTINLQDSFACTFVFEEGNLSKEKFSKTQSLYFSLDVLCMAVVFSYARNCA